MADYEAIIGLEVHAQLKTKSKLFCSCPASFGDDPNKNTCPVCAGMPGALPVVIKKAVEYATKMALALSCEINLRSVFARKNYFYPDLPKGYQISQYEEPLAEHGKVKFFLNGKVKEVGIKRLHMEDDAGKLIHVQEDNLTFVDLNRTGVPLIEIVSEPEINSPDEAVAFLKMLRNILLYLGICDANMEEGNFRCDANVSIRPKGEKGFGTRTELKNMNSFRHIHKALTYEIERQKELLEAGKEVIQETRLYDESKGITRPMRGKEEAHDYRYFPDPDLVPVIIDQKDVEKWKKELPELPFEKQQRFLEEYGLSFEDVDILTSDRDFADYFEEVVKGYKDPKTVANWMKTEVLRELHNKNITIKDVNFSPAHFVSLLNLIKNNKISLTVGKQIFPELFHKGLDPVKYINEKGLVQISDEDELRKVVLEVIKGHPEEVESYKKGKKKLLSFFMGQVMKKTKGKANPKLANQMLREELEK